MTCSTPDKGDGLAVLTEGCKVLLSSFHPLTQENYFTFENLNLVGDSSMQAVEEKIVGSGGNFVMQMAPKVKPLPVPAILNIRWYATY